MLINPKWSRARGVTLIMVAGVLAVLAAMSAGFYALTESQTRSALGYTDVVNAEMMAHAGVEDAIGRLREQAFLKSEDPTDPWFGVDYQHGASRKISFEAKVRTAALKSGINASFSRSLSSRIEAQSERYTLNVSDAASKINVNACDNLGVVLDNLCRVIGAPLSCADLDSLQPARWAKEGATGYGSNKNDTAEQGSCYYMPTQADKRTIDPSKFPVTRADGSALYGDGYAIARYRAAHGLFRDLSDVLAALSVKANPGHPELELLERNVKFAALREYITISSWVDTTTVCTGKFEWISSDSQDSIAIDRDKSWIEDDPNDTLNLRGSLRGCYLAIVNGHGAGQLRRIKTNGADWVKVDKGFTIDPGPISSYMIVAKEDALTDKVNIPNGLGPIEFPRENADGTLQDDPNIDYAVRPLCIHRAPVNINTASDKVLAALFMGINIQHGHPMAVGTDADLKQVSNVWRTADPQLQEPYLLTSLGIKRVPVCMGKLVLDRPVPWSAKNASNYAYINNFGALDASSFVNGGGVCNEAHELAYRVIRLREHTLDSNGIPLKGNDLDLELDAERPQPRGPFTSWDDFYFRVVRPWDNHRADPKYNPNAASKLPLGPLLMANFNPNTDILKFNPNIEWIDRWGRNFTEMEPVMQYTNSPGVANPPVADPITAASTPIFASQEIRTFHGLKYELKDFNTGRAGTYVVRSYRYRSTDLIDKTDLNRSTCEFSFDSGGIFEIASTGQVVKNGEVSAERRIEALVKVYEVWRETTQAQFVRGSIMKAKGAPGSNTSGTITRAQLAPGISNVSDRLALVTQPEPLVPKLYTIVNKKGLSNSEVVDPQSLAYDAWGQPKQNIGTPDIVANHVLPAVYDGQITLATNTAGFDPDGPDKDTFLASFNGDLDTDTCKGNGREQAKMPHIETGRSSNSGYKFRVVDTCGLLGVLNDDLVDMEPEQNLRKKMYMFRTVDNALSGLKSSNYWNNVTLRQGDLRTEGVFLSSPGVSGNESTLKYLVGEKYENFNPGSTEGLLITMWFKSTWKHSDGRNHEFFNASNPGKFWNTRACYLQKEGRWAFSAGSDGGGGISAHGKRANDLMWAFEGLGNGYNPYGYHGTNGNGDGDDADMVSMLHGGRNKVHEQGLQLSWEEGAGFGIDPSVAGESPMYRVQPFRWNMTGVRLQYEKGSAPKASWTQGRPFKGGDVTSRDQLLTTWSRPFMLSQMYPEGPSTFKLDSYWAFDCVPATKFAPGSCEIGRATQQFGGGSRAINFQYPSGAGGTNGQDVKWNWADPKSAIDDPRYTQKVFVINNLNYGNSDKDMNVNDNDTSDTAQVNMWNYRHMPDGGTYAVIDELKISKRETVLGTGNWANDRVFRELNTSRYYLPADPKSQAECPTFESQTMLESIKGSQLKAAKASPKVTLARVTWTVFTPRFMHEYLLPGGKFKQDEILLGQRKSVPFKGPFWYETYNNLKNGAQQRYDLAAFDDPGNPYFPYRVNRIPHSAYPLGSQPHSTKGVEIELLNGNNQITVGYEGINGVYKAVSGTFINPDAFNTFRDPGNPNIVQQVDPGKLRYRVRFRYPVDDKFVDPSETVVDPGRMLLLDTPVFDDISITYFTNPRMLSYRLVNE